MNVQPNGMDDSNGVDLTSLIIAQRRFLRGIIILMVAPILLYLGLIPLTLFLLSLINPGLLANLFFNFNSGLVEQVTLVGMFCISFGFFFVYQVWLISKLATAIDLKYKWIWITGCAIGACTPCSFLGLLLIMLINQKATRQIRARGGEVGFLGAKLPEPKENEKDLPSSWPPLRGFLWAMGASLIAMMIITVIIGSLKWYENGQEYNRKQNVCDIIQAKYFGPENGPWPKYQRYLRDAALARSRGNYNAEEVCYRKVLHLLNQQHFQTDQSLTGRRMKTTDNSVKSDEDLMNLLHELLKNN